MEGYQSKTGKKALLLYMGENYGDPMVVYREYVQNACDAVDAAFREGIISDGHNDNIVIKIDQFNHEITIMDRGIGVRKADIGPILVDVASSQKNGEDNIGKYGIGRLIGAKYCKKIVFETSYKGENEKSELSWDVERAQLICNTDDMGPFETNQIIDEITSCKYHHELEEEHYFRVKLLGVSNEDLLDENKVRAYLAETVPVDYSFEFKEEIINPSCEDNDEYRHLFECQKKFKISVNEKEVRKFYSPIIESSISDESLRIGRQTFFKLEKKGVLYAWGWYALNEKVTQMNSVPFKCLRLRKHNMAVGNFDVLSKYFPKAIDNTYVVGEIFITNPDIKPSGSRDDLTDSDATQMLKLLMEEKFKTIKKVYDSISRLNSKFLKPITDAEIEIRKLKKQAEAETEQEKKSEIQKTLKKKKEEIDKKYSEIGLFISQRCSTDDASTLADDMIEYASAVAENTINEYNNQTNVVKTNGQIRFNLYDSIKKHLSEDKKPTQPQNAENENDQDSAIEKTKKETHQRNTEFDAYTGLNDVEMRLIKKVHSVLDKISELSPTVLTKIKTRLAKKISSK